MKVNLFVLIFSFLFITTLKGQDSLRQQDISSTQYEKEILTLEKEKVAIEKQRLNNETTGKYITGLSILIPLLTAIVVLLIQKRNSEKLQEAEANANFQIKVAEIILASKSTKAAENRAEILMELFPLRIPKSFVDAFSKNENEKLKFPGLAYQEKKIELFKALTTNLKERKEVLRVFNMVYFDEDLPTEFIGNWEKIFPEDIDWTKEIETRLKKLKEKSSASKVQKDDSNTTAANN